LRSVGGFAKRVLAELVPHHIADGAERVEADEVGEGEGPHRVGRAGHHRLVDLLDRADALLVGADRVEHVGHEQAVHDEAGLVLGLHGGLAELLAELETGRVGLVAGGHAAHHLEQLHHLRRVEEVQPEELVWAFGGPRPGRSPAATRCWWRKRPRP